MKRVQLTIAVVLLGGLAVAQNPPASQPTRSGQAAGQASSTQASPTQATPPQASTGGTTTYKTRPQRQAQKQDEFQAFQAGYTQNDAAAVEKAADDFAAKFKNSELREELYFKAMTLYQAQNNAEKAIEMGRKSIETDPDDARALVMTGYLISERTRDTDLDRDQKLAEATKDAQAALAKLDNPGMMVAAGTPPDKIEAARRTIQSIAYAVLGQVDMLKDNFTSAEANLRKSTELAVQPDAITWLRLALALDRQKKYQDALVVTNKALDIAGNETAVSNLIKSERQRLLQLTGAAQPTPTAQPQGNPKQ